MTNKNKGKFLPHLLVKNTASPSRYSRPPKGITPKTLPPIDRKSHSKHLLEQLKTIEEQTSLSKDGIYLSFEAIAPFELKLGSLESIKKGIELCSVKQIDEKTTMATVFVPDGELDYFLKKITEYAEQNTTGKKPKPKNEPLISSISDIKQAALKELWTDSPELYPTDDKPIWWEVWLRHSTQYDCEDFIREHATKLNMQVGSDRIKFLDRTVILIRATKSQLSQSIHVLNLIAEVRAAKDTASFYTNLNNKEQKEWIDDALKNISLPPENSPYVCILDTGVNEQHPLLKLVAHPNDMHSYIPAWGSDDRKGHGTNMAGITIYGDLTEILSSNTQIDLTHRIESVKVLPNSGANDKNLYGAVTQDSIARVEIQEAYRKRLFCMAVTTTDSRDRGKPSSWSAAIDASTSGYLDEQQRLLVLSAGNTDDSQRHLYPDSNFTDEIHDPAQSWNALTVGAYTEKVRLDEQYANNGWETIALFGDLSPSSCTSTSWDRTCLIKPEIVMEGGNQAISPCRKYADYIDDDLQLLTTGHDFQRKKLLVSFGDTSAASALASRLAAKVQASYPDFWAETVRALLVHSAEWTDAMRARFHPFNTKNDYRQLLRYCGYGVPNERNLFWSANNSLTLIAQDSLQPFIKEKGKSDVTMNEMNIHSLPWPSQVLQDLPPDTQVEMKVTLSYFVEPNPGQRGWKNKYRYASHGLRFDVRRPLETIEEFKSRLNQKARDEEDESNNEKRSYKSVSDSGTWILGDNLRSLGSIHSDTWYGLASELAMRGHIAIYPVSGWWKDQVKQKRWHKKARYSLIITIKTPGVETDIYTVVKNEISEIVVIQ